MWRFAAALVSSSSSSYRRSKTTLSNFSQSTAQILMVGSAQCARVLLEFTQSFLQPIERVAHPTLDGVLSDAGDFGDLLEWKVSHFSQEEHLALLVRKLVHGLDDPALDEAGGGGSF